jgi:hypothetical protein
MPKVTRLGGAAVVAALCFGCKGTPPPALPYDFSSGEGVVRAMHDRYYNRWYETLTYVQNNLPDAPSDTVAAVWLTAISPPRRMRIDFEPRQAANGLLSIRDTQYVVVGGRPREVIRRVQPLLVLQHDIYFVTPTETIGRLRELGFDLSRAREETWDGRAVYVVGANDPRARQFWVDRDLMLLVRLLEPAERDPSLMLETRLLQYDKVGAAWVPRRIESYVGGQRVYTHQLTQIRADVALDSLLFSPDDWTRGRHWYQQAILR